MAVITLQGQDPLNLGMRNICPFKPFSTEAEDNGGNGGNGNGDATSKWQIIVLNSMP